MRRAMPHSHKVVYAAWGYLAAALRGDIPRELSTRQVREWLAGRPWMKKALTGTHQAQGRQRCAQLAREVTEFLERGKQDD